MPELNTPEEALAYLATIWPGTPFRVSPFEMGWVCTQVLTPEEMATGKAVGLASMVIDSQTGVVTSGSSLADEMVANWYVTAKRTGQPVGHQIYPPQWRITLRRTREDQETVDYLMTAISQTNPPEPTVEHLITVDKASQQSDPPDTLSMVAASDAGRSSQQNQGIWPEQLTTEF